MKHSSIQRYLSVAIPTQFRSITAGPYHGAYEGEAGPGKRVTSKRGIITMVVFQMSRVRAKDEISGALTLGVCEIVQ